MSITFERIRKRENEKNIFIKSDTKVEGHIEFPDITGPLWNIFYINLKSGSFSWKTKNGVICASSPKFFIYLPVNCLCIDLYEDAQIELVGLYSNDNNSFGDRPFFVNLDPTTKAPNDYKELIDLKNSLEDKERHYIEYNESPTQLAAEFKRIIDDNFHDGIEISYLCEETKKAAAVVSREFKKSYSIGPKSYLNLVRINYAEFLLGLERDIKDVVFDVGFKDFSRFYKVFKNKLKETPKGIKVLVKES